MIYTIKKDTNNDTRFRIPDIFTGKFKKTWVVSLAPNCWYPKELGYNQINKLVGVTEFWSANNKNSVMVGWDPCYLPEEEILEKYPHCKNLGAPLTDIKYFNIYYYVNDNEGRHLSKLWTVVADWRVNDSVINMRKVDGASLLPQLSNFIETSVQVLQFSGTETAPSILHKNPLPKEFGAEHGWGRLAFPKEGEEYTPYQTFITSKKLFREIFLWFGGTRKAPQDMLFKVG